MPIPGNLTTITVTGEFLDANGNPLLGTVSFAPPMDIYDAAGAAIISRIPYVATLSPTTGAFSITLPCSDNAAMNPTNWGYTITISLTALASGPYTYTGIAIPHTLGASVDLTGLLPPGVPTTITPGTYGLLASANLWAAAQSYQQAVNGTWAQANIAGDTTYRFTIDTSGKLQWGPGGAAALDTDLYRSGAGILKTDGSLTLAGAVQAQPPASTTTILSANVAGTDAFDRLRLNAAGQLEIGPGTAARDVRAARAGAGQLALTNPVTTHGALFSVDGNILIGASAALGDNGVGELQIANAATIPSTNPSGGAVAYANTGALWSRDPQGAAWPVAKPAAQSCPMPGALAESAARYQCTSAVSLTSGTLYLMSVFLVAGTNVGHIGWCTGATAASGPTHWWAALLDNTYTLRAHTADQTSTALPASTWQLLATAATYTATYTGQYYLGLMVATSTTQPTILSTAASPDGQMVTGASVPTPLLGGTSTTALTGPGTDGTTVYAAPTAAGPTFYMYAAP